jgi:threonine/homoserine/homoserine lactone efflux protein
VRIWAAARHPLPVVEGEAGARVSVFRSFALGFATQVSNPKTAIVYASVFAAFLPSAPTLQFNLVLLVLIFVVEAGWYAIVALILSAEHPREIYRRYKAWLDRLAGGVMIALGARLIASARNAA